jgi:hypothetical protein
MEYFLGSLTTLLIIGLVSYIIKPSNIVSDMPKLRYSQSHIFELVKPILPPIKSLPGKKKIYQSTKHEEKTRIKVIILDKKAYWVKDNLFYVADIDGQGIDKDNARVVDTIHMDKVQLDKMLFIMDQLRDGKVNDNGDSRDQ